MIPQVYLANWFLFYSHICIYFCDYTLSSGLQPTVLHSKPYIPLLGLSSYWNRDGMVSMMDLSCARQPSTSLSPEPTAPPLPCSWATKHTLPQQHAHYFAQKWQINVCITLMTIFKNLFNWLYSVKTFQMKLRMVMFIPILNFKCSLKFELDLECTGFDFELCLQPQWKLKMTLLHFRFYKWIHSHT